MANIIKWDGEEPRTFRPSQLEKCVAWLSQYMGLYVEIYACVLSWDERMQDVDSARFSAKLTETKMYCHIEYDGHGSSMFAALSNAFENFVKCLEQKEES